MTHEELEIQLRGLIKRGSTATPAEFDVIPGDDSNPRPELPYASLQFILDRSDGYPVSFHTPGSNSLHTQEHATADYSVQWFGRESDQLATRFRMWMMTPPGLRAQERANLRILAPVADILDLDAITGPDIEHRRALNLRVAFVRTLTETVDVVERMAGQLVHDGDGTVIRSGVQAGYDWFFTAPEPAVRITTP